MLAAIQFDNELMLNRSKVDHVRAYRDLAAKFDAVEAAVAQEEPQCARGHPLSQAGEGNYTYANSLSCPSCCSGRRNWLTSSDSRRSLRPSRSQVIWKRRPISQAYGPVPRPRLNQVES